MIIECPIPKIAAEFYVWRVVYNKSSQREPLTCMRMYSMLFGPLSSSTPINLLLHFHDKFNIFADELEGDMIYICILTSLHLLTKINCKLFSWTSLFFIISLQGMHCWLCDVPYIQFYQEGYNICKKCTMLLLWYVIIIFEWILFSCSSQLPVDLILSVTSPKIGYVAHAALEIVSRSFGMNFLYNDVIVYLLSIRLLVCVPFCGILPSN